MSAIDEGEAADESKLALRGEQIYCAAIKRADAPIVRYPDFLYAH